MSGPSRFSGFPAGTLHFLRDLAANNSREWFAAHRSEYEEYYLTPAVLKMAVPSVVHSAGFPESCAARYRAVSPVIRWLVDTLVGQQEHCMHEL